MQPTRAEQGACKPWMAISMLPPPPAKPPSTPACSTLFATSSPLPPPCARAVSGNSCIIPTLSSTRPHLPCGWTRRKSLGQSASRSTACRADGPPGPSPLSISPTVHAAGSVGPLHSLLPVPPVPASSTASHAAPNHFALRFMYEELLVASCSDTPPTFRAAAARHPGLFCRSRGFSAQPASGHQGRPRADELDMMAQDAIGPWPAYDLGAHTPAWLSCVCSHEGRQPACAVPCEGSTIHLPCWRVPSQTL
jgi:hypothetical protein